MQVPCHIFPGLLSTMLEFPQSLTIKIDKLSQVCRTAAPEHAGDCPCLPLGKYQIVYVLILLISTNKNSQIHDQARDSFQYQKRHELVVELKVFLIARQKGGKQI